MTSLRWIEEHEGGENGEDDDVDGVHHQPGHQQPPGPFLESKHLQHTQTDTCRTLSVGQLTTRRLTSIEYSKQESMIVSTGATVQGDIPYMSYRT